MYTGVSDRLIPDAVDLITDDRVHISGMAHNGKSNRHGPWNQTFLRRSAESFGKIVSLHG
jgi:hypothetical protein